MTYKQENNNIVISNLTHFDIYQTLDSGQCFRYEQIGEKDYLIIAHARILRVKQEKDSLILYNTTFEEYETIWHKYFSFDDDYELITCTLSEKDEIIKDAACYASGVRILKQDLWETIITFILSQNNNIKRIKQNVKQIADKYGKLIGEYNEIKYYSFPTPEELSKATVDELHGLKIGFRDKYIYDACQKIVNKDLILDKLKSMSTSDAKKELLKIKGIGNKVADCILLFGLHRYEVFPTDTWVRKIMISLYIKKEVNVDDIPKYALEYFGEYASYAQQYLFHYARKNKIE